MGLYRVSRAPRALHTAAAATAEDKTAVWKNAARARERGHWFRKEIGGPRERVGTFDFRCSQPVGGPRGDDVTSDSRCTAERAGSRQERREKVARGQNGFRGCSQWLDDNVI